MIRILHVSPKMDREGIQSFLMNVYRHIDRQKVQFDFVVHSKKEGAFDGEIASLGGKIYRLGPLSSLQFFYYKRDLFKIFREYPYKIIHSHINLLSAFTLKIAMEAYVPIRIAHSHSSSILDVGIKRMIKLYAKKHINDVATHKMACSKEAAIWQFGEEAWKRGEVGIIPNGIDISKFLFSAEKRAGVREKYNIREGDFVVGHVGAFRRVKNHSFLLKIFSEIKRLNQKSKLLLLGSGEMEEEIRAEALSLGISKDVIFAGNVENASEYLSAMDAFVFPSIYEGLGMALVESQASGLPCFVSDGVAKEAKLQENYYLLSLSSPAIEWAKVILKNSKSSNRQCEKKVFEYDIQKIAKEMESFYLSL